MRELGLVLMAKWLRISISLLVLRFLLAARSLQLFFFVDVDLLCKYDVGVQYCIYVPRSSHRPPAKLLPRVIIPRVESSRGVEACQIIIAANHPSSSIVHRPSTTDRNIKQQTHPQTSNINIDTNQTITHQHHGQDVRATIIDISLSMILSILRILFNLCHEPQICCRISDT